MKKKKKIISILFVLCFSSGVQASLVDGLVAHYSFENDGNDSSAFNNNATELGGITYTQGVSGLSANFDGVNDHFEVLSNDFNFNNELSLSLWIKPRDTQLAFAGLVDKSHAAGSTHTWVIQQANTNSSEYYFAYHDGANWSNPLGGVNSAITQSNEWNHLVITKQNGMVLYFVDGILVSTETNASSIIGTNNLPLWIGGVNGQNRYFNGNIDELRIYNRALTDLEIQELYNEGSAPNEEEPETQSTDCQELSDLTCISLENRSYGDTETPDEMRIRYKNNILFYNSHPEYHNPKEIVVNFISTECIGINLFDVGIDTIYSAITFNLSEYLNNVDPIVYGIQCYNQIFKTIGRIKAYSMLSHFLSGSGSNVKVNMETLFNENKTVTHNFITSIKSNISQGFREGQYTINQQDWAGGTYSDWNLALGTVVLKWETNGEDLVIYLNDKYSFDINPGSSGIDSNFRWSSPLYLDAANLILKYEASDFFMVGKFKGPLELIY